MKWLIAMGGNMTEFTIRLEIPDDLEFSSLSRMNNKWHLVVRDPKICRIGIGYNANMEAALITAVQMARRQQATYIKIDEASSISKELFDSIDITGLDI